MMKILVIGGSGMIASRFVDLASKKFEVVSIDENTVDITDNDALKKYFDNNPGFDCVINFAAYTNVDGAELQRDDKNGIAWRLNVGGPENLAKICKTQNIFLIHISTDFVFPGTKDFPGPYEESTIPPESPNGLGWYAWTKNRAENVVSKSGVDYAIVRFGYPFRADNYGLKKDWARNLVDLYNEHKLYPLFNDQVQNILFVDDLVDPLAKIISGKLQGVFHIASHDTVTPYEYGIYLLEKYTGQSVDIQKSLLSDYLKTPGKAPRPILGGLKVEETEKKLGIRFKTWREMIDEFIVQMKMNGK